MAEVIHYNYLLIPVIGRFGIKLGFGDKTVKTLCQEYSIDTDFFLAIINTFSNSEYFPEKRFYKFNVAEFIKYLRKTHQYYITVQIPLIEKHINALVGSCNECSGNLELVKSFFLHYKQELEEHLTREETITFPYIETINALHNAEFDEKLYLNTTKSYSMKKYIDEHNNMDDKLLDLQNILIKYINGNFSEEHIQTVLYELFRLEKDIINHTRLEETILRPIVEEIELTLKSYIA